MNTNSKQETSSLPVSQTLVHSKSIKQALLLKKKPFFQRLYVFPFLPCYVALLACSFVISREIAIGSLAVLVFFNILTFLSTFWSISFYRLACFSIKKHLSGSIQSHHQVDSVLIIPEKHKGKGEIVPLLWQKNSTQSQAFFSFQQNKFHWNQKNERFEKPSFPVHLTFGEYAKCEGLSSEAQAEKHLEDYGWNRFHIPQPTFMELFQEHAVAPFFLFQVFCVGLWMLDEYWYYSVFTLFMLVVFECTVVQQRISSLSEFKTMSIQPFHLQVRRASKWIECESDALVPGDLVEIVLVEGKETVIPCDLLLLEGMCVMNEAMLSGESTPLQKESIQDRNSNEQLSIGQDKMHILFAGTKLVQVNASEGKKGALCYVLRTGFHTTQGKLVRTMIYNSEAVSANNLESFLFILLLLVFAIAASTYVWFEGMKDAQRSRFKLILECIIIITQVIPPELPMELSLAVNTSLMALSQFAIFCTEPFRIPFAGKIDVCCLDKTGTITEEKLNLQGLAGLEPSPEQLIEVQKATSGEALSVLGGCHSLIQVEGKLAGDPMEIASFSATEWDLLKTDVVFCNRTKQVIRILKKFHFSSALRRMSTVCSQSVHGASSGEEKFFVAVKGAPEAIQGMLESVPEWYEEVFLGYARQGCRVIALASKQIPRLSSSALHAFERDQAESKLRFTGFLVFHCPLKKDSMKAIRSLVESSHKVVMVTGDNSLTSIHVARVVGILPKDTEKCTVIDFENGNFVVSHEDSDETPQIQKTVLSDSLVSSLESFTDLCITGPSFDALVAENLLAPILPRISVFARASPLQKESLLLSYKENSLTTLMCGDGTNDVGALKQAHVGVALLDGKPEDLDKIKKRQQLEAMKKQQESMLAFQKRLAKKFGQQAPTENSPVNSHLNALNSALNDDFLPAVRLGDASVAAPFTSKISTLESICNIIRQGRCTLVTTLQMYKILALNSLISAYSLSVLHLDGIRYADVQSTIMGFLITFCFLFLSKAKPLQRLSPKRPQSNIFNFYILSSIMLQFGVNLLCLLGVKLMVKAFPQEPSSVSTSNSSSAFQPNLMNSLIYLISLSMQVCTFMVNYQGHPFRESLMENKPLRICLFGVAAVAYALALEIFPDINDYLQIVRFPALVKWQLVALMSANYVACFAIEKGCQIAFANENATEFFPRRTQ